MNATARQAVYKKEGGDSLALSIYEMVAPVGKNSRQQGGKAMATRIRRAGVAVALALLAATVLAGVAHAKIISGTPDNDYLLGTIKNDFISKAVNPV